MPPAERAPRLAVAGVARAGIAPAGPGAVSYRGERAERDRSRSERDRSELVTYLPRLLASLAARAWIAPISAVAISFLAGCCAAAWISAGTRTDSIRGVAALLAGYLAGWTGRLLAAAAGDTAAAGRARALGPIAAVTAEYAVLAGLAAGAVTPQWHRPWELAAVVAILISLRTTMRACRGRPAASKIWPPGADRLAIIVVTAPVWGTEVTLLALAAWEIAAACYALAPRSRPAVETSQDSMEGTGHVDAGRAQAGTGWGILGRDAGAGEPTVSVGLSLLRPAAEWPAAMAGPSGAVLEPQPGAGPEPDLAASLLRPGGSAGLRSAQAGLAGPLGAGGEADEDEQPAEAGGRSPENLARCRDDGVVARWLGRPVRGNLAALPPAIAGLAATATVAVLGLDNLPGPLVLTPVVAMLLAAAGSSYRHVARPDWLVPAILQAGQFLFIGAVGFGRGVPAPVTFALCAMIALHYVSLAGPSLSGPALSGPAEQAHAPDAQASHRDAGRLQGHAARGRLLSGGLGWDGRMIVIGLSALVGVTMFAYLALTAYLGVLICSKIMTICHSEGVGR